VLFADDAVRREFALDAPSQELLGAAVGRRHGRAIGLELDRGTRLKVTERELTGLARGVDREVEHRF
jgi:hypothetical protein